MKIILCGYNWAGCKALDLLLNMGHEIFVYTHEAPEYLSDLVEYCEKKKVRYSLKKIELMNLPWNPDIICSIYYKYIISDEVIEICNKKIFNLHPSLLPKYRGCSSLTWAIINGEEEVGFTYHYIDSEIDTGKIILQKSISLEPFDIQSTIYNRVMFEALNCFIEVFNLVVTGFEGIAQDNNEPSYYKRGCPLNGEIDDTWNEEKIKRFIRALIYPPLPYARYKNTEVKSYKKFLQLKESHE